MTPTDPLRVAVEHLTACLGAPGVSRIADNMGAVIVTTDSQTIALTYGDLRALLASFTDPRAIPGVHWKAP